MAEFDSDADIFDRTREGPNSTRGSKALEPLLRAREQGARTSEPHENCITSGSPLCRGLIRATYILCIEHLRPKRLSRESNPGPSALQANTLCKEPFEMALLTAIRNLGLYYYSSPPSRDAASSWLEIVAEFDSDADLFDRTRKGPNSMRGRKALDPLLHAREQGARTSEPCENCITSGSPPCRGLTRATYILCIEHPR